MIPYLGESLSRFVLCVLYSVILYRFLAYPPIQCYPVRVWWKSHLGWKKGMGVSQRQKGHG
jgi:hypothetical protein